MRIPRPTPRQPFTHFRNPQPISYHLSPASARTLFTFSLLLDPLILSQPLHPVLRQWSSTALVLLFVITVKAAQPSVIPSLAQKFVRKRLAILSSSRTLTVFFGILSVTIIAEAALVFGRAATPLLLVGAALGIPGALAIIRAFRSQFDLIRRRLEERKNFEAAVERTTTALTIGSLFCSRLCGFFTGVSLIPFAGAYGASLLGSICALSLLFSTAADSVTRANSAKRLTQYRDTTRPSRGEDLAEPPIFDGADHGGR